MRYCENQEQTALIDEKPDSVWYLRISRERGVTPRCPFASVARCPRYYLSLSLMGEAGSTKIPVDEDERLKSVWVKSDLWPQTAEQEPGVASSNGSVMHFSEFCPEIMYDRFGVFVKGLGYYWDELDRELTYQWLEKEGIPRTNWLWQWQWIKPLHFTECPVYSPLSHGNKNVEKNAKELLTLKPTLWGFSIDLKEFWRRALCRWKKRQ